MLVPSTLPADLFEGMLGPELVVLSLSIVRSAQRVDSEMIVETADGPVSARVGDFVITTDDGEHYPIPAFVFYGTYQILGAIGTRFVGRRLLHARRAWDVLSAGAEFDYGPRRGKIAAPQGGWLYRSDETDFGYINPDAKKKAHTVVGTVEQLNRCNWEAWFLRAMSALSWLSPALTLIALLAYTASLKEYYVISRVFLTVEGILLAAAVIAVWWIRRDRWVLKYAVASGTKISRSFQGAAELLGEPRSEAFPAMALWRAAQKDSSAGQSLLPDAIKQVKEQVSIAYEQVKKEIREHHTTETLATTASWSAAAIILSCIAYASLLHSLFSELLAIWLPSVVAAVHGAAVRRHIARRISGGQQFVSELAFVQKQLYRLAPENSLNPDDHQATLSLSATLRVLCRAVAEHSQRELQFAAEETVGLPI